MVEEEKKEDGIKDIKEVFYDNLDNWPTETIKKNLFRLRPEEGAEVYLNLSEGYHDITNQGLEVEKKFRPKVTIRTQELKTELDRWKIGGGAFFRVIGDSPNLNSAMKLCIQYFIVWTRQLFPFQFSFLSIPFFIATLFLSQFTLAYQPVDANLFTYLTFLITGLLFICLGIWTYFEGLYKRFIKGYKSWKTVPDSMIGFVVPGLLFWTTALEYAIYNLTSTSNIATLIPVSAWLSLLVGAVILFIGTDAFLRGEKSYVEKFSHPMDYAPLMLYLYKNKAGNWDIEGTQFDYFHYKTSFISKEKLSFDEEDEKNEHPSFLIDRSWHAFREYIKPNLMIRLFANVIFNIIAWLIIVGVYVIYVIERFWLDIGTLQNNFDNPLFFVLIYVLLPVIAVFMLWSISRTREYKLDIWEDLSEKDDDTLMANHHLSYDRLRILWNLRNREHTGEQRFTEVWSKGSWIEGDSSRLVARVKMQFPFDRYKDWHTLRDTQEELLSLIAVQTKEEELRKLHAEIAEVKRDLQKQMIEGIDSIEEELDEYFDEQKEDIEEERAELKEKLGVIEDEVVEETTTEEIDTVEEIIDEVEPEVVDPVDEIIEEIEEATEDDEVPLVEETIDEHEIPDIPDIDKEEDETPVEKEIEDLGVPDIPEIEKPEEEPAEEEEFTIPDIPIDVEKEED